MTPTPSPRAIDEVGVLATEEAYDRAWCAGDLDALLECLAPDAVLVNPRGEVAIGTGAIRAALGDFLGGEAAGSTHEATVDRISFVGDDVAVVDGRAVVGQHLSGADPAPLFEHAFTDILVRSGERWLIAHVRAYGLHERGDRTHDNE